MSNARKDNGLKPWGRAVWPVMVAVVAATALAGSGSSPTAKESADAAEPAGLVGVTHPIRSVSIGFPRSGRVTEVAVQPGSVVRAGDVLARQDDTEDKLDLAEAELLAEDAARLEAAEIQLRQRKANLQRVIQLRKSSAASDNELEQARNAVEMAQRSLALAKVDQRRAEIRLARAKLALAGRTLRTPVGGVVVAVAIEPGEAVGSLSQQVRVVDMSRFRVTAYVPLAEAMHLKAGQQAGVQFPNGGPARTATIRFVSPIADASRQELQIELVLDNPANRPAGEAVTVELPPARATPAQRVAAEPADGQ